MQACRTQGVEDGHQCFAPREESEEELAVEKLANKLERGLAKYFDSQWGSNEQMSWADYVRELASELQEQGIGAVRIADIRGNRRWYCLDTHSF